MTLRRFTAAASIVSDDDKSSSSSSSACPELKRSGFHEVLPVFSIEILLLTLMEKSRL